MSETIVLPDSLRLPQMVEIQTLLAAALEKNATLELSVPDGAQADLSFVQLIEAARSSAGERASKLRLTAPAKGTLLDVLKRGGFLEEASPSADFWLCKETI